MLFTPFGLGATAVIALLVCLFTGTGYKWFSGCKATRDSRGFDILPDGTHGSSGFLTRKEMGEFLEVGGVSEASCHSPGTRPPPPGTLPSPSA